MNSMGTSLWLLFLCMKWVLQCDARLNGAFCEPMDGGAGRRMKGRKANAYSDVYTLVRASRGG